MRFARTFVPAILLPMGCSGTGQPEVTYSAYAAPAQHREVAAGAWTVEIEAARVAFGPVAFCASASGSATLCETAVAEIGEISTFSGVDASPQLLGTVHGFEGVVRSASYDYGIHWFLTESAPTAAKNAPGGHSAHFAGVARRGADSLRFVADVDVVAQFQGQRAVPSTPVAADIRGDDARLDIHFDAGAWIAEVDFDAAFESGADPYRIAPGSTDHTRIVIAMVSGHPPRFVWSGSEASSP